jgi:phospholipid/cholesterol/gamma-HCH transport system permease protein
MYVTSYIENTGRRVLNALEHTRGSFALLWDAFAHMGALRKAPVREVFYRQVFFTGVEAMGTIAVLGALIGIVIITQITNIIGANSLLMGKILVWIVVRELGPLLAAFIIIARSSTAIASELGSMKANKEIMRLRAMGISELDYLIVPRILGTTICVFVLTFYFLLISITGGMIISSIFVGIPFMQQLNEIFTILGLSEIIAFFSKSLVFGLIIATVSSYHGLRVQKSITEIPQVTSRAVMQSLSLIFLFDGIITLIFFI